MGKMVMRFELSTRDVLQIVQLIYTILNLSGLDEVMYMQIANLINKIKDYGLEAFESREKYRDTIRALTQKLVNLGHRLGLSKKGEE
jgi:hypothetical protein